MWLEITRANACFSSMRFAVIDGHSWCYRELLVRGLLSIVIGFWEHNDTVESKHDQLVKTQGGRKFPVQICQHEWSTVPSRMRELGTFYPLDPIQYDPMLGGVKRVGVHHVITIPLSPGKLPKQQLCWVCRAILTTPTFQLGTRAVGNIWNKTVCTAAIQSVAVRAGGQEWWV